MVVGSAIGFFLKFIIGIAFIWLGISGLREPIMERRPFFITFGYYYGERMLIYCIVIGAVVIVSCIASLFGI